MKRLKHLFNGPRSATTQWRHRANLTLIALISMLSGCVSFKKTDRKKIYVDRRIQNRYIKAEATENQPQEQELTITVWIHGTKGTLHQFPIGPIIRFFETGTGLHHPSTLDASMHHRSIAECLVQSHPERFPTDHVYLFGWSGNLSFEEREQHAHELYSSLQKISAEYKAKYDKTPRIRIISHSHGGNVALNLAKIRNDYGDTLSVDELILLACPVQDYTEEFITHSIFKNVYVLYSATDMFQVLDPQGAYKNINIHPKTFFSRRRFNPHTKIAQVNIRINNRAISHVDFMLAKFISMIPHIIDEIKTWPQSGWAEEKTEHILSVSTRKKSHKPNQHRKR